jgi:hypothetical protein
LLFDKPFSKFFPDLFCSVHETALFIREAHC